MKKINLCLVFVVSALSGFSQTDEAIPFVTFSEITVNLTFPEYRALKTDGGFIEIDGGLRGIILYRVDATTYNAYERNCPYRATEACARVEVDVSKIFLIDRCCGAMFNFSDGYPMSGPASRPLRRYRTSLAGALLSISDEVVN